MYNWGFKFWHLVARNLTEPRGGCASVAVPQETREGRPSSGNALGTSLS